MYFAHESWFNKNAAEFKNAFLTAILEENQNEEFAKYYWDIQKTLEAAASTTISIEGVNIDLVKKFQEMQEYKIKMDMEIRAYKELLDNADLIQGN